MCTRYIIVCLEFEITLRKNEFNQALRTRRIFKFEQDHSKIVFRFIMFRMTGQNLPGLEQCRESQKHILNVLRNFSEY